MNDAGVDLERLSSVPVIGDIQASSTVVKGARDCNGIPCDANSTAGF